jgi:predicted O-methyltransferase YrrM
MKTPEFWPENGHFNLNQYYYVKSLVEGRKIEYALETGFHTGRSALSILNNCEDLKTMVSIDIIFVEERRKLLEEKFANFRSIESDSKLVLTEDFFLTTYPEGINYCLVDGDHSYNGCLSDLELVLPHMKDGGLILIDDYESGPPDGCPIPEVTAACDDFYKENSEKLSREKWHKEGKGFCIFTVKP